MTLNLIVKPTTNNFTVTVRKTPVATGIIADVPGYTFTYTSSSALSNTYYSSSANFLTGDFIHVLVTYTSLTCQDLTVQLLLF